MVQLYPAQPHWPRRGRARPGMVHEMQGVLVSLMKGYYPAIVLLCGYLFVAAAIRAFVPRAHVFVPPHGDRSPEVPCRWNSEDDLRRAYESLPERRRVTRARMKARLEERLGRED